MYVFDHDKDTQQKMIWSWIICYFNIISQGWLWTLAFILQTSKFYYIQIWLFFQRTRTFTIISTDCVISWISSKVGCEKIDITNILVYRSLKKSTSWKNKLGFYTDSTVWICCRARYFSLRSFYKNLETVYNLSNKKNMYETENKHWNGHIKP